MGMAHGIVSAGSEQGAAGSRTHVGVMDGSGCVYAAS